MIGLSRLSGYATCLGWAAFVLSGCGTEAEEREPNTLWINELVPRNGRVEVDFGDGAASYMTRSSNYVDWIELYNASDSWVDLSEYSLGEAQESSGVRVKFGPGPKIKPHWFVTVWAHNANDPVPPADSREEAAADLNDVQYHVRYDLEGHDEVYLFSPEGKLLDAVSYIAPSGTARVLARYPDGEEGQWYWCPAPSDKTRGYGNRETCATLEGGE